MGWQGSRQLVPIQEDETALVLWALCGSTMIDIAIMEFAHRLYRKVVIGCADFMVEFRDPQLEASVAELEPVGRPPGYSHFYMLDCRGWIAGSGKFCPPLCGQRTRGAAIRRRRMRSSAA